MTLADFTRPGLIVPRLRGRDAATVIQELAAAMQQEGRAPDGESLCRAALNRELFGGTDMEGGMAFPHARLAGVAVLHEQGERPRRPEGADARLLDRVGGDTRGRVVREERRPSES